MTRNSFLAIVIYLLSALASGTGFVTQMLVTGFWTTAYGNEITYYSLHIAFYFLALGIGSLTSHRNSRPRLRHLFAVLLLLSLVAECCVPVLRILIREQNRIDAWPILFITMAGFLAGQVIPLSVRLSGALRPINLGKLYLLDYLAALLFSIVFIFLLLEHKGFSQTALILGWTSALLTSLAAAQFTNERLWILALGCAVILAPLPVDKLARRYVTLPSQQGGAGDLVKLIQDVQSVRQKIVLTEEPGDGVLYPGIPQHFLYLGGVLAFSSRDEQQRHACFVNVPMTLMHAESRAPREVLVLGGGDGLAARNLLANSRVKAITVVEEDAALLHMAERELSIRIYNLDSLRNPRVRVQHQDPFWWVRRETRKFDLILVAFPAPQSLHLSRYYTAEFYSELRRLLADGGLIVTQGGPAFNARAAEQAQLSPLVSSLVETWRKIGAEPRLYVGASQNESFLLVGNGSTAGLKVPNEIRRLMPDHCQFRDSWNWPATSQANTLNHLVAAKYLQSWFQGAGLPFHHYRSAHAVFLPH